MQAQLFHVFDVEERIRPDHPLRDIKRRIDGILQGMSPLFAKAYSHTGRPSVPPERLLMALLLMTLYSVQRALQCGWHVDPEFRGRQEFSAEVDERTRAAGWEWRSAAQRRGWASSLRASAIGRCDCWPIKWWNWRSWNRSARRRSVRR